jgi:hypothetical protein
MKLSTSPWRRRVLNCTALLVAAWVMWHVVRPYVYLFVWTFQINESDHSPESDEASVRQLASLGPDVVGPILRSIKANSPWSKRTAMLPSVLQEIGQPAHDRLKAAIQSESSPRERSYLIYSLQFAFKDSTFLPLYLDFLASGQSGSDGFLSEQLILSTLVEKLDPTGSGNIKIPNILRDSNSNAGQELNPDFVKWYAFHSKPKGPLPYWRPRQNPNAKTK